MVELIRVVAGVQAWQVAGGNGVQAGSSSEQAVVSQTETCERNVCEVSVPL